MKHVFYFITFGFIIYEMMWVLAPKKRAENNKKFDELIKKNEGLSWDNCSKEYKSKMTPKIIAVFINLFFLFGGLLTFQWPLFLLMMVLQFIVIAPLSKLTKFSPAYTALYFVNSVIGLSMGVFVIVNAYHLNIDIYELLMSIVK